MDKEKIYGRQHRIHLDDGTGKPVCGVKKWKCLNEELELIECKFCLRKIKNKEVKQEAMQTEARHSS